MGSTAYKTKKIDIMVFSDDQWATLFQISYEYKRSELMAEYYKIHIFTKIYV
jgi:hypothetical protein